MIREWLLGGAVVLLLVGIFLGGFATREFLATSHQDCFAAQEATAMIIQKVSEDDEKELWVVKIAFVPADWHRTYPSPQEAPRTRHMAFWSVQEALGTMAPILFYASTTP
jgi:hypothetical protein